MTKKPTFKAKRPDNFAEFTHRESGPADCPALTVKLECTYSREFCGYKTDAGERRQGALARELPKGSRAFLPSQGAWFIHPEQLSQAIALALRFYKYVYEVEGSKTTEHHTGRTSEQGSLF